MSPMANLITSATGETRSILEPALDRDWSVVAGDVDWSCWQTAAHIADDLFSYASQVVAQPLGRYLPVEAAVDADATPEPAELSAAVLARLFPQAPAGDPSAVLLWCTGRTRLADRPRLEEWRWDSSVREPCRPASLHPDD